MFNFFRDFVHIASQCMIDYFCQLSQALEYWVIKGSIMHFQAKRQHWNLLTMLMSKLEEYNTQFPHVNFRSPYDDKKNVYTIHIFFISDQTKLLLLFLIWFILWHWKLLVAKRRGFNNQKLGIFVNIHVWTNVCHLVLWPSHFAFLCSLGGWPCPILYWAELFGLINLYL